MTCNVCNEKPSTGLGVCVTCWRKSVQDGRYSVVAADEIKLDELKANQST